MLKRSMIVVLIGLLDACAGMRGSVRDSDACNTAKQELAQFKQEMGQTLADCSGPMGLDSEFASDCDSLADQFAQKQKAVAEACK